jgi:hypothetical protein
VRTLLTQMAAASFLIGLACNFPALGAGKATSLEPNHHVASLLISEDLVNSVLTSKVKAKLIKNASVAFDPEHGLIFFRGLIQVPIDELRAVNLDPKLGAFRVQMTIKPEATPEGFLILEFPLNQTFFYPADSKNPSRDKVIVPVQMLSLALASARGYFAALAGDFSSFDRREAKVKALIRALNKAISSEKNPDALDAMKTERASQLLQLASIPLERKQLQTKGKEVASMLGFLGEKELNLNDGLAARQNALILKLDISKLAPYLQGVNLSGVRLVSEGKKEKAVRYLAIDVDDDNVVSSPVTSAAAEAHPADSSNMVPALVIQLNQSFLESAAIKKAEESASKAKVTGLNIHLKNDGLHVSGNWEKFFFKVPFDAIVDLDSTETDVFEVSVRDVKIASIDFQFLTGYVLEAVKDRFEGSLHGICTFRYLGEVKDDSRVLEVTINPKRLVPAFADLHLIDVDVRESEFLLKIGEPD